MIDGNDSGNDQKNADQDKADTEQANIGESIERKQKNESSNGGQANSTRQPRPLLPIRVLRVLWRRRTWRRMRTSTHHGPHWAEITTVCLTAGIVIVTIIQALIYNEQADIMRNTLNQNERGVILNSGQLALSIKNAQLAKDNLDTTINQFHLDQRAWIGPKEVAPPAFKVNGKPAYLKTGEQFEVNVALINSGKTPSKNIYEQFSYRTLDAKVKFTPRYPGKPIRVGVIQPGSTPQLVNPPTVKVDENNIAPYLSGEKVLYIFGSVTYEDVFAQSDHTPIHHTTFCMYLVKTLDFFTDCETYNDAD